MFVSLALGLAMQVAQIQPISVGGELCHPRNLLVKVESEQNLSQLSSVGVKVLKYLPQIHWAIVEAPDNRLLATRSALTSMPGVEMATLDRAAVCAYTPNDPLWPNQWNLVNMNVDKAWDRSLGSSAAIVAVIDTGVQMNHPDLAGNIWTNTGEIPGNGIDDDHNGYVDDVHGYDFANLDGDPTDDYGHGTSCAGIVAAVGDNSTGLSGVAPRARIMVIKCGNSSGYFYDSATVPAYLYATDMGARVFSMSYYSDHVSPAEEDGINYAASHNVLPVAAAGNDSTVYSYYPGAYEKVLSVAAVDSSGNKAGFSDFGTWVDVAAPGVGITTVTQGNGYTSGFSGTSAACPHVAGLAALLIGANPAATAARVRRTIEDTATPVFQSPYGEYANNGFVNAEAAMAAIVGRPSTPKPSLVRWVSPIGNVQPGKSMQAQVYGRNLNPAIAYQDSTTLSMSAKNGNYVHAALPTFTGVFDVRVGGVSLGTFTPPVSNDYVFPLIEGSSPAYCSGGYADTLNADSAYMRVTRQGNGQILLQATFRNLPPKGRFTLVIKRLYTSGGGTESLQFYNWASASYPYGSFDTFSSGGAPTSNTENRILIPDISPYVDYDRTAYFRVVVDSANSGEELHLDQAYLEPGKHL